MTGPQDEFKDMACGSKLRAYAVFGDPIVMDDLKIKYKRAQVREVTYEDSV